MRINWKWIKKLTLFSLIVFLITFIGATMIGVLTKEIRNRDKEPNEDNSGYQNDYNNGFNNNYNDEYNDFFNTSYNDIPNMNSSSQNSSGKLEPLSVTFTVDKNENGAKPIFTIHTNLPNNTRILVQLTNESGYKENQEGVVMNGEFVTNPFSQYNAPLRNGDYKIKIMMLNTQYPSVQEVIGENNEALTGDFVKEENGKKIAQRTMSLSIKERTNPLLDLVAEYTTTTSGEIYARFRATDKDAILACNEDDWLEFIKLHRDGLSTYPMANIEFLDNSQISFTSNMKDGEYKAVDEYGVLIKKFYNTIKYSIDQKKISLNVTIGNDVAFPNIKNITYYDYNGGATKKDKDLKNAAIEYIESNQTYMNHTSDEYVNFLIFEGCPRDIAEAAVKEYF